MPGSDKAPDRALLSGESRRLFRLPRTLMLLTLSAMLCVATAGVFGYWVRVDKLVPASGVLETRAPLLEIRAPVAAPVHQVHVQADARVLAQSPLVTLDARTVESEHRQQRDRQRAAGRQVGIALARLSAVMTSVSYQRVTARLDPGLQEQLSPGAYQAFAVAVQHEQRARTASRQAVHDRLRGRRAERAPEQDRQALLEARTRHLETLHQAGAAAQDQVNQARLERLSGQQALQRLDTDIQALTANLHQLQAEQTRWQAAFITEQLEQLWSAEAEWLAAAQAAHRLQIRIDRHTLRAPVAGRVSERLIAGAGVFPEPGETLLKLRPEFDMDDLYTELSLPSRLAPWVQPGMTFRAVPDGNSADEHGSLHGTVEWLSPRAREKDSDERRYRVHGRIDRVEVPTAAAADRQRLLRPGLQLAVQIRTGERRLLRYLLDPFSDHIDNALREP